MVRKGLPPRGASGSRDWEMGYWVYIVACADGTFYTGVATDVPRRIAQHNGERVGGARYTAARRPVTLHYQAPFPDRSSAQKEEARIKALPREGKLALMLGAALSEKEIA